MSLPELLVGPGTAAVLRTVLARYRTRRPLVVATDRALRSIDAERALAGLDWWAFSDFTSNPRLDQVVEGCRARELRQPDLILGVGGGSAMDVAKAVRLLPADPAAALAGLLGDADRFVAESLPLILVSTTAGSGSEVTGFATMYDGGHKHSLDHPRVGAETTIVDPYLMASCPHDVTTSGLFDAVSHAVESYWSRRATDASRALAREALALLSPLLGESLKDPCLELRERLIAGALAAGRAIAITRTTAAHAFAYALTIRFGIPHGVACMLNLRWLLDYNRDRSDGPSRAVIDEVVHLLGPAEGRMTGVIAGHLRRHAWPAELSGYGVGPADLADLVAAGMGVRGRAGNNPVDLDRDSVCRALAAVL
ncbi:phosphonoacetaldehyde reductase [Nonomuraea turkmeniaca]|uniref:Phosphonoacetaldehyde reductase n=1 Tax=Nonomuraea turkmeniaca TaxID=103838 RepID=A0A5S4GHE0_9ACTN|nr:phosphonoacetaldehyde reductase [Nonomuraea turkmeniaca]TMR25660.1 phosphonoacetaldehyde reductase [Nonomuraea turkmeniaca]